jgi:hypothetical protein
LPLEPDVSLPSRRRQERILSKATLGYRWRIR